MRVTDSAGNSSIPVERTIDVDTEAPKAPELNQVTGDNLINASEAAAGFDITGTGEPGATITLAGPTLAGGNTATVQNDGTWSIPVTKADVTAMGEGNTNLSLTQTDPAGNISDPTTQSITVDALPAILSADMSFGEVLTPDEMDEQADLTVKTANIEDGATISISIDGVSMTPVSATIEANKAVFSASAEELQSLRDGTYEFTLTVTDFPSVQKVQSFKKTGDIDGTENDDTITPTSGPNNTPYADGDGDNVDGGDGTDDYIDAKGGNDIVDGGQGNDIIHGGTGNDILNGGVGDDTLDGGSGNDLLRGDTGNDSLKGGDGQDDLQGGDGDDSLDGGDGNDVLDGGTGADTLTGGAGRDEFKVEAGDTVTDFDIEEDKIDLDDIYNFDTLALWNAENPNNSFSTPLQWLKSDQADGDGLAGLNQNGVPINLMNDGAFINASDLTQTNTGVVCYGAKTRIETIDGLVEIDRLQPGDLVKTGGNGHHPIRWIRGRTIFHAELQAHPNLVPVRIKAGAMGKGLPKRDLIISQHHRMIVSSDLSSAETGSKEIFIAAKDLIGVPGIEIAIDLTEITYWHFICDQHQVVFAEGAASESLYTGPEALKMLGAEARAEIYQIFPELRDAPPHYAPKPARPILTQAESKSLIFQHYRSRTALCRQNSDAGMRPV
jgi:Ca2+-binding RTX toxin-like protein